jgi:cation:H+ antiporter
VELVLAVAAVLVGLVVLVLAADRFVVGAEGLALRLRWPPVVIGAVVVGFGTSLPELTTSVIAALAGEPDLALGNAAGSNVANLLLVLGVARWCDRWPPRGGLAARDGTPPSRSRPGSCCWRWR